MSDYIIMEFTSDGPSRIDGKRDYGSFAAAEKAAKAYLADGPKFKKKIIIMQVEDVISIDPKITYTSLRPVEAAE